MDRIQIKRVRGSFGVAIIVDKLTKSRLILYGHIMRRSEDNIIQKNCFRSKSHPENQEDQNNMYDVQRDMNTANLEENVTEKRREWGLRTRKAKPKRNVRKS